MCEHELMGAGDRGQRGRRRPDVFALTFGSHGFSPLEQSISAQGNDCSHGWSVQLPSVATMTALIVWSRFSAWSKTIE